MAATFVIVRRVFRARTSRSLIYPIYEGVETMIRSGGKFEIYPVALCFPAIIIAIVAIALYLKERNKRL